MPIEIAPLCLASITMLFLQKCHITVLTLNIREQRLCLKSIMPEIWQARVVVDELRGPCS